jgi:hypothetical protein
MMRRGRGEGEKGRRGEGEKGRRGEKCMYPGAVTFLKVPVLHIKKMCVLGI